MKSLLASLCFGLLATLACAQSREIGSPQVEPMTAFYLQPSVVVAIPGSFDTAVGGGVAIGVEIAKHHALEFEVISFTAKDENGYVKMDFMPLLATYKYRFPIDNHLSFYVGGSAGAVLEKLNDTSFYYYSNRSTQAAFAGGGVIGANYAFNRTVSLDLSGKILYLNSTDFTTSGNIGLVQLGLKIRF